MGSESQNWNFGSGVLRYKQSWGDSNRGKESRRNRGNRILIAIRIRFLVLDESHFENRIPSNPWIADLRFPLFYDSQFFGVELFISKSMAGLGWIWPLTLLSSYKPQWCMYIDWKKFKFFTKFWTPTILPFDLELGPFNTRGWKLRKTLQKCCNFSRFIKFWAFYTKRNGQIKKPILYPCSAGQNTPLNTLKFLFDYCIDVR